MAVTVDYDGFPRKVTWTWTSDSNGDASEATAQAIRGRAIGLETDPASGGDAPDADYDVGIQTASSRDILGGAGSDRHTSLTEYATASNSPAFDSVLTLVVSSAGNANSGTAVLFFE